jgi:RNA polymerase sigma-70 factor (ECF subfamily)
VTPANDRLLQQLRGGDEAAFRELYRLHTPRLFAVTLRLLSRSTDAEDAVQEAWLRAVRGLGAFRQESSFETWLTGIGIRCALEMLRKRSPLVVDPLEPSIETVPHLTIDLERAIAGLPDGYRACWSCTTSRGGRTKRLARCSTLSRAHPRASCFTRAARCGRALVR